VLGALVVAAVGLTMLTGGTAVAKDNKKAKAETASVRILAEAQATVDANTVEYAGTVDGTDAYIAVVVSGKDVRVYVCDGDALSAWALGEASKDGTFAVEAANGTKITGTISDTDVSGTVTLAEGSEHAFAAQLATSPAGLYERLPAEDASGEVVIAATIVLADGTQRGAARPVGSATFCANVTRSAKDYLVLYRVSASGSADGLEGLRGYITQFNNLKDHGCPTNVF
jgi:hypothetical protein